MIDQTQRLAIFQAQTRNVRELKKAWAHVNRQINSSLLRNDRAAVAVQTKLLALIYCALAEALFSKMIHTPHGLALDEIGQIKSANNQAGVRAGWIKCAQLAVRGVEAKRSSHVPNVLQKLSSLIEALVFDPSLLRNKLAHGQWSVALNRDNTAVNANLTREIEDCTVIHLYRRVHALEHLSAIIEDLIESPNRAHPRDYWLHLTELEDKDREISAWTMEQKIERLRRKRAHTA